MPAPAELLTYIDGHTDAMSEAQLQAVGATTKRVDSARIMGGQTLPLPNAILGRIGAEPAKKTVGSTGT
ncbi:hypothetical protein B0H17DRAFT_1213457 [Mycena rosella]|uniref:Uncharacterized protein n=1 Tax=Mycena rosella TaxID=1033263 RepID=A0AAD7G1W6_MYCRO|nr:hypothetical protein B0H17DRAFT_1213457 [Mycena rosella]